MKIIKKFQGTVPDNKIMDTYSTSSTDTYSCRYMNENSQQFPIGYVYISAINTSPASLFGGTWVQLKSRYLYATGQDGGSGADCGKDNMSTYTGTSTQLHTLTANQSGLRSHSHTVSHQGYYGTDNYRGVSGRECVSKATQSGDPVDSNYSVSWEGGWNATEGHSHNVSYIAVYVWQRTA